MNEITHGGHGGPLNDWFDLSQEGSIRLNWQLYALHYVESIGSRREWVFIVQRRGNNAPLKRTSSLVSGVALCLEMTQALESQAVKGAESSIQIIHPLSVLKWRKKKEWKQDGYYRLVWSRVALGVGSVTRLPQFYTGDNPREWTVKRLGFLFLKGSHQFQLASSWVCQSSQLPVSFQSSFK